MRKKEQPADGGSDWSAAPSGGITPADVQQKEFRVARVGGGYRMREVDEFLDQVTDALSALIAENERLRDAGPPSAASSTPASRPAAATAEDRAAVDAFLHREREFLQSLGSLVQGHAEELREMVRAARRPAVAAAAAAADPPPADESGPPALEEEDRADDERPEEPAVASTEPGTEAPATVEPGDGTPATPDERAEEPITLEGPEPARSRRSEDGAEGSLRELFWGEE